MLEDHPYSIEVLDRALDVIEGLLAGGSEAMRPSELARRLGLNRTRVFRILKTLEKRGYVFEDAKAQGFRLSYKFLAIGEGVKEQINLRREAAPILMKLADQTGDVANLMVLFGEHAVCVDRYQGDYRLQVWARVGDPLPLHIGASPKLLLAYLPDADREAILQKIKLTAYTPKSITDSQALRQVLDQIRQQGYSVDEEDFEEGVCAVGAPVWDHTGNVVAGITLTIPASRFNPERRQWLVCLVQEAAGKLSANLGYQPVVTEEIT